MLLKKRTEFKIGFIGIGKLLLTDNGSKASCVLHLCIGCKKLVRHHLVIFPCIALAYAVFHKS